MRGLGLDLLAVLVREGEEIGVVDEMLFEERNGVRGHVVFFKQKTAYEITV